MIWKTDMKMKLIKSKNAENHMTIKTIASDYM